MDWDESPETHENYRQFMLDFTKKYIDQLLVEEKAYKIYTEEELAAETVRSGAVHCRQQSMAFGTSC